MPSSLIDLQRRYVALHQQIKDLEQQAKDAQAEKDELEETLAEQMGMIGQKSTQVDGMRLTVRVTPRIGKRGDVPMEDLCRALENTEFAFLVKPAVNAMTLQASMKEIVEERGGLPEELVPLLRQWDQNVVAVTKT